VAGGLYVPGVHGYMGYVAGFGGMRALLFLVLDLTSNIIWTIALVGLGALLANRIGGLTQVLNVAGIVMVALFVLSGLGIWYSKTHRT
jgi:membrane protein DedA with SNARE-associated domain